eukprot:4828778-Prymnesium_polylepis.2
MSICTRWQRPRTPWRGQRREGWGAPHLREKDKRSGKQELLEHLERVVKIVVLCVLDVQQPERVAGPRLLQLATALHRNEEGQVGGRHTNHDKDDAQQRQREPAGVLGRNATVCAVALNPRVGEQICAISKVVTIEEAKENVCSGRVQQRHEQRVACTSPLGKATKPCATEVCGAYAGHDVCSAICERQSAECKQQDERHRCKPAEVVLGCNALPAET